jgi:hypothetical protein
VLAQPFGHPHLAAPRFENPAQGFGAVTRAQEARSRDAQFFLGGTLFKFRSPRVLQRPYVCEFDEGPVGRAAAAAIVSERALGRLVNRSRGGQGKALRLGEGQACTILGDFSDPDSGVEAVFLAHSFSIGTNRRNLNPR